MTFIIFKNEHKKLFADKVCKKCGKTFVPKNSGRQAYCGSIRYKNTCAYIHNIEYRLQYQEHWNKLRRVNNNTRMRPKTLAEEMKDLKKYCKDWPIKTIVSTIRSAGMEFQAKGDLKKLNETERILLNEIRRRMRIIRLNIDEIKY